MTEHTSMLHPSPELRATLSKVPEVTLYVWIIKVLCTTVGDTFAGTAKGFGLGTTTTSIVFLAAILAVVILMTIQQRRQPVLIDEND